MINSIGPVAAGTLALLVGAQLARKNKATGLTLMALGALGLYAGTLPSSNPPIQNSIAKQNPEPLVERKIIDMGDDKFIDLQDTCMQVFKDENMGRSSKQVVSPEFIGRSLLSEQRIPVLPEEKICRIAGYGGRKGVSTDKPGEMVDLRCLFSVSEDTAQFIAKAMKTSYPSKLQNSANCNNNTSAANSS